MTTRFALMVFLIGAGFAHAQTPPPNDASEAKLAAEAAQRSREGVQLHQQGQTAEALVKACAALEIHRRLYPASKYPAGHADLARSLNNVGFVLFAMSSYEKALPPFEEALAITQKLYPVSEYPDGHPDLARSLNNLGRLLHALGAYQTALPHYERALAMKQKLYPAPQHPDGHAEVALGLNNLASVLEAMGSFEAALPHHEQALAMTRRLYPAAQHRDGHPDVARSLINLGGLLHRMRAYEKALPHVEQALAMYRKLYPAAKYPDGHANLAVCLGNLGNLLQAMGSYERALPHAEQAVAMYGRLYPAPRFPEGHPALTRSLNNLGSLLWSMGSFEKALTHVERALTLERALGRRLVATAAEAEALAFVSSQPLTRDAFLSLAAHLPDTAASAYNSVWAGKSAITRVLEQRHAAARLAGTEHAVTLDELKGLRRRIDQLLHERRLPPAERDRLLTKATADRDRLERALAQALPTLQRAQELDALGPDALGPLLPNHAALIDIVRYTRFAYDRAKPGKTGETRTPCYAAFLVSSRLSSGPSPQEGEASIVITRIELGEATAIDQAIAAWRLAIARSVETPVVQEVRDLVWSKLAAHLPPGTKTLYLAADADLARLPWAALPVGPDRVLLEEYSLAQVPHGPFLLEQLKYPKKYDDDGSALALGDVAYHSQAWPDLLGTALELKSLAFRRPVTLIQDNATAARVLAELPKARYAHFATHGFFDAEALTAEKKRAATLIQERAFGDETRRAASKNPLGFTGLVLAKGEVLTGLTLVDLPLENLKLTTLSACETGLGEFTGGEGVQGLQRAFHLAGCPNVVASLWKVNDAATAALMAKFYHELWVNKKPPIEALREAQLTIYRHPELIPDLAGERGPVRLRDAVATKSGEPSRVSGRVTAETKLWAAFVLSGPGR